MSPNRRFGRLALVMLETLRRKRAKPATDARHDARAELDEVEAGQADLPGLHAEMESARTALTEKVRELEITFVAAQTAYTTEAGSLARRRMAAERTLRSTAHPVLADRGPLLEALRERVLHLKIHLDGVSIQDDHVLLRAAKNGGVTKGHRGQIKEAKSRVDLAQSAKEVLPAVEEVLDRLLDEQLKISTDPVKAARAIMADLPKRCACGEPLDLSEALTE